MALKQQVFSGSLWSFAGTAGQQFVNFILFALLARLLTPTDFGVMALAAVVIDLLALIGCLGQIQALVQREEMDDRIESTSFWMLQGFGLVMTAIVFFSAPYVAAVFDVPSLSGILRLLAPVCLFQTLSAVHEARLRRSFGFKWLAARMVIASMIGGVASIVLAFQGFGVYAMVGQRLIIAVILCAMVWWSSGWRPKFLWDTKEALQLARFGSDLSIVAFLQTVNVRIIDVMVGYFFGPQVLGQLRIAWKLFDFIAAVAIQPVVNVALPALSRLQASRDAMGSATVRLMSVSGMVLYPIFFGIAITAQDLVPPLFGDQWGQAILFIEILAPIAVAAAINYFLGTTLTAAGRTRWILWQATGQVALALVISIAAVPFGVVAVLVGNVIRATIIAAINVWLLDLAAGVRPKALMKALLPPLAGATVMVLILWGMRPLFLEVGDPILRAIATASIGAVLYGAIIWFIFPAWRRTMKGELLPLLTNGRAKGGA